MKGRDYWLGILLLSAALLCLPAAGQTVASVTLKPASVTGGTPSTGTVKLSKAAPSGGLAVKLASNASFAAVPKSVTVPAAATSANFTVTTDAVAKDSSAQISAQAPTGGAISAKLSILAPRLTSVTVTPNPVFSGQPAEVVITLTGPAATGGDEISLSSNQPSFVPPSFATVPAGKSSVQVSVKAAKISSASTATITAKDGFGVECLTSVSVLGGTTQMRPFTAGDKFTYDVTVTFGSTTESWTQVVTAATDTTSVPNATTIRTAIVTTTPEGKSTIYDWWQTQSVGIVNRAINDGNGFQLTVSDTLPFPLTLGSSSKFKGTVTWAHGSWESEDLAVTGVQAVSTPAGVFECWVLSDTITGSDSANVFQATLYLAPELGFNPVMETENILFNGALQGTYTQILTSTNVKH
jgi:hypothetical protein